MKVGVKRKFAQTAGYREHWTKLDIRNDDIEKRNILLLGIRRLRNWELRVFMCCGQLLNNRRKLYLSLNKTDMKTLLGLGAVWLSLIFTAGNKKNNNTIQFVEIGVNVSDTVRSLAFYTKIFGMKRVGCWHVPTEMSIEAGVNSGRSFDLVILQLECDGYVLNYKLNQTENNKNITAAKAGENYSFEKTGLGYLTFNVKNVDPYVERIKENNIKYKLVILPNLPRVVLLHDPDGALLEIYERKD